MSVVFAIRTHLRELNRYSHIQFSLLTDCDVPGDTQALKQAAARLDEAERSLSLAFRLIDPEEDPRHIGYIITEQLSMYELRGFPRCGKDPQVDALMARAERALNRALSAIREVFDPSQIP
jgi:hypothetical protein